MIPKKIHQIYFDLYGKPFEANELFVQSRNSLIEKHPEWEYKLWSEEECLELLETRYPHLYHFYKRFRYKIQQIDFIKCVILHAEGGFYVDLDNVAIKPMDDLVENTYLFNSLKHMTSVPEIMNNDIMASEKGWGWWEILFRDIKPNYEDKIKTDVYDTWKGRFILQTTGPRYMHRLIKQTLPNHKPFYFAWTKWRNEKWKTIPKENYHFESFVANTWVDSLKQKN